jgi:very-long-chain ceramide synthase
MNVLQAPKWLPEIFIPFFTLSYPATRPTNPDSYPTSNYYGTGRLDACFVLTWILVLGILRECLRLGCFEPFGRQYLYRKDMVGKRPPGTAANVAANGAVGAHMSTANGEPAGAPSPPHASPTPTKNVVNTRPKGMSKAAWMRERSAVRFAEQGWQITYYLVYWPLGLVRHSDPEGITV